MPMPWDAPPPEWFMDEEPMPRFGNRMDPRLFEMAQRQLTGPESMPVEPPMFDFPEGDSGPAPWKIALAESLMANPIRAGGRSDLSRFLTGALSRGGDVFARRTINEAKNAPSANRGALAPLNRERLAAARDMSADRVKGLQAVSAAMKAREKPIAEAKTPEQKAAEDIAYRRALRAGGERAPGDERPDGLTGGDLDPATLDMVARTYLQTGALPPLGMGAAGVRTQILRRAAAIDPNANIGGAQATFRADSGSLAAIQKQMDAIQSFKNTAKANAQLMLKLAGRITDTGSPLANQVVRLAQSKALGSVDVQNFQTALAVFQPEAARILNNPNLSGQLTDAARHELQAMISGNMTLPQLQGAVATLNQDFANREAALAQQRDLVKGRIKSGRGVAADSSKVERWDRVNGKLVRVQ